MIYVSILLAVLPSFWAWARLDSIDARISLAQRGTPYERALLRQHIAVIGWWMIAAGLALMLSGTEGIALTVVGAVMVAYAVAVKIAADRGATA